LHSVFEVHGTLPARAFCHFCDSQQKQLLAAAAAAIVVVGQEAPCSYTYRPCFCASTRTAILQNITVSHGSTQSHGSTHKAMAVHKATASS
jgi:hypothetical protein